MPKKLYERGPDAGPTQKLSDYAKRMMSEPTAVSERSRKAVMASERKKSRGPSIRLGPVLSREEKK